jgi:hypothetical protein
VVVCFQEHLLQDPVAVYGADCGPKDVDDICLMWPKRSAGSQVGMPVGAVVSEPRGHCSTLRACPSFRLVA